ncbi:cell division protein ZapE [Youhaiella tibetensis]|uniref:cell division protein ZapE n=1 Tax=Paradevosia tibetensis TaxID=1447062 RepID=UPI001AEF085C|nr:cell division protein ZapE [Youhaiella tibetensis]
MVGRGAVSDDPLQRDALRVLDRIASGLGAVGGQRKGLVALFARRETIKGAYLVGDVGRGKTMLMDLFFGAVPIAEKRRVHFHEFMSEVHEGIIAFRAKAKGKSESADPIAAVTKPLVKSLRLLCLDEFHVHDITNAMLLQRLFEKLFEGGVTLVATSNVVPDRLYENGLNRQLFLPFITLLKANTELVELDGPTDYRRLKFEGQEVYFFGPEADAGMDRLWERVTGGQGGTPAEVRLGTRRLKVPRAAMGAARFDFADLCEKPLGAFDYLKLAHAFDTLFIDHVPQLDRTRSDASKRLILLIDTLYDRGVKLAASFAAPLEDLGQDDKTRFEFARTVSRLIEMQSTDYLNAPRKPEE